MGKEFIEVLSPQKNTQEKNEKAASKRQIQELQKDLNRKDKALAETTVLLVLKKTESAIWGRRGVKISLETEKNAIRFGQITRGK